MPRERKCHLFSQYSAGRKPIFSACKCYFVPQYWATMIKDKLEFGPKNKSEKNSFGVQIKSKCLKLETDRLGNIVKVIGHD